MNGSRAGLGHARQPGRLSHMGGPQLPRFQYRQREAAAESADDGSDDESGHERIAGLDQKQVAGQNQR